MWLDLLAVGLLLVVLAWVVAAIHPVSRPVALAVARPVLAVVAAAGALLAVLALGRRRSGRPSAPVPVDPVIEARARLGRAAARESRTVAEVEAADAVADPDEDAGWAELQRQRAELARQLGEDR